MEYFFFLVVLVLPWPAFVAGLWSLWGRRASIAMVAPTVLGALAWSCLVIPQARRYAGCDRNEAIAALFAGGVFLVTLATMTFMSTILRLRVHPRWTVLVPAMLIVAGTECATAYYTLLTGAYWSMGCAF